MLREIITILFRKHLVTESQRAPACRQVRPMRKFTNSLEASTPSASASRVPLKYTGALCRERASADLLKSVAAVTANQRRALRRSAEGWTLRAVMLERIEKSFEKRRALNQASREYKSDLAS